MVPDALGVLEHDPPVGHAAEVDVQNIGRAGVLGRSVVSAEVELLNQDNSLSVRSFAVAGGAQHDGWRDAMTDITSSRIQGLDLLREN